MRTLSILVTLLLLTAAAPVLAHHPAEDIVDPEIYDAIEEMVSDTPHADFEEGTDLDTEPDTMTIETEFVSAAEALIQQGLLSYASMLEGDVIVTIDLDPPEDSSEESTTLYSLEDKKAAKVDKKKKRWSDWGGEVTITITRTR